MVLRDGKFEVRSTVDPKPGPGELLLKTLSTAICASDVHFMDHPELGVNDPTGRSQYEAVRDMCATNSWAKSSVMVPVARKNCRSEPASLQC